MPTDPRTVQIYNENADNYAAHVRNLRESVYHSLYEKPAMYEQVPRITGKRVISLGCGSGEDAHYLKSLGATEVIGIDIARGMIESAKASYKDCNFKVMDVEQLDLESNSFDFAFSSLTMHYLESWKSGLSEVFRILKPNSYFLLSCFHPINTARVVTEDTPERKVRQLATIIEKANYDIEVVGDYLGRSKVNNHRESIGPVTTWHKSISEIFDEVQEAGFVLEKFIEPKPLPEMKSTSLADYNKLSKIPAFMIIKLLRP